MSLKCGIVGLPNVGKSTLFNALTKSNIAQSANYPFCTIDPNIAFVDVKDNRLDILAKIEKSEKIIYPRIEFVDIAGLVKDASKGEGLGNKFLSHIREVDIVINLVRAFKDKDINHISDEINPKNDIELIETELILSDLEIISNKLANLEKKYKSNKDNELIDIEIELSKNAIKLLEDGKLCQLENFDNYKDFDSKYLHIFKNLPIITSKKQLYIANLDEKSFTNNDNELSDIVKKYAADHNCEFAVICAKFESELINMEKEDRELFLQDLGIEESALDKIIKKSYDLLDLITYFTVGVKEAKGWEIKKNTNAKNAAGKIHSDFEKGFIKAEIISYDDFVKYKGHNLAKDNGKVRIEGKDYIVNDGDIIHFKFNN